LPYQPKPTVQEFDDLRPTNAKTREETHMTQKLSEAYLANDFLERVKRSYRLAIEKSSGCDGDIWPQIDVMRRPVHDALMASENDGLREIFADPLITDLFYGVDNLASTVERLLAANPDADVGLSEQARDQITKLAQALGVTRWVPRDAEQFEAYGTAPHAKPIPDTDELLDAIEQKLGFPILFPTPFRGERGASTSRGVASYRAIAALYQAVRVTQEARITEQRSVLEIGAGMGRTAYYAVHAGIDAYTTIDLPMGVVAQACFLGATLGPDALWMLGEDEPLAKRVRLLPSTELHLLQGKFGVVLNVDSLTEMGEAVASRYVSWIAAHADIFLSINHEANGVTIPALAEDALAAADYRRFPYWMRPGYAEEIFRMPEVPKELAKLRRETSSLHQTGRRFLSLTLDRLSLPRRLLL
jgi:hypothetical protein